MLVSRRRPGRGNAQNSSDFGHNFSLRRRSGSWGCSLLSLRAAGKQAEILSREKEDGPRRTPSSRIEVILREGRVSDSPLSPFPSIFSSVFPSFTLTISIRSVGGSRIPNPRRGRGAEKMRRGGQRSLARRPSPPPRFLSLSLSLSMKHKFSSP